jgi:glycogen debranching enzyme
MNGKERLTDRVRALMRRNLMEGYSALLDARYCYIAPSLDRYQSQWFWDTCFHVFILCALGEMEIAKRNKESLFKMQTVDGVVGHMIFWHQTFPHRPSDILQALPRWQSLRPHVSALIQPPLVAKAVKRIYEATGDRLFLYGMLPRLIQYHEWLARTRDFDGDCLISIISPFESGIDWKPSFDETVGTANESHQETFS